MKKIAIVFGIVLNVFPAFALADSLTPAQMQIEHLTAIVAALEVQAEAVGGQSLACALLASNTHVAVNEPFFLGWGSVGAVAPGTIPGTSMYPQNGVSEITIQNPGTWTYSFDFYGTNGATTTCDAKIIVSK